MLTTLTASTLHLQARLLRFLLLDDRRRTTATPHGEEGQATAEYALVLLGAAAVALLVVAWATKTNSVGRLLDAVFGQLLGKGGVK